MLQLSPYPDINAVLHLLLVSVRSLLGEKFIGLYLHGSLAWGDFDPQRSDIDFFVATADELAEEMLAALETVHTAIFKSGLPGATRLEGSYISRQALKRYDPKHAQYPTLHIDGSFGIDGQGSDGIILRYILREKGITVAGPDPHTLIDAISDIDLRYATLATLQEWWRPMLDVPFRLFNREYQAYAVLTMCRAHYTLHHGTIVSKPVAARWAQEALGNRWNALIERALSWRQEDCADDIAETLEFICYTIGVLDGGNLSM